MRPSLSFMIFLPELDPLLPCERYPRKEQAARVEDGCPCDCLAVFAAGPKLILAITEVVGDRLAIPMTRPNDELLTGDLVAGNPCGQERGELFADDINPGNFVDTGQGGSENL